MTQTISKSRLWLMLMLLCATEFMMVLDFSIVNVALSAIQQDLGFSQPNLQWLVSAYALAFGGFLLLGGKAADLFGRRRVLMLGLGLFTLASLVGGCAQSQSMLIVARSLQGLGAASVSPAALSILTIAFAEGEARNRALSIWGAVAAGGFAAGVLLGGILTDVLGWRSVMFINVPIGLLALVLIPLLLPESRERSVPQLDVLGAVTVTSGLVTLVYALQQASDAGWDSIQTLMLFAIALALLGAFAWIESFMRSPLIPLRVFRSRRLTGANLIGLLMAGAIAPSIFVLTLYMQQVLNYSALQTGLAFLPHGIAAIVAAAIATPTVDRFGTKNTLIGSMSLGVFGLLHLSWIPVRGEFVRDLLPGTALTGFSIVMVIVAVTIAATTGIEDREQGMVSGLLATAQEIGAALGLAIVIAVATDRTQMVMAQAGETAHTKSIALTAGFRAALSVSMGLAISGVLVAILVLQKTDCRKKTM
jgi:EmrB/QacA subfamily drug resistance transporter